MKDDIKVSVLVLVYNHEKFLKECLESIVNQETNFKYEILIHDDASTDYSPQIIKEFHKKYPDKIVPVYEKENQYSKGVHINTKIMLPKSKGKYVALCEGDDCWCDTQKLQRQYDFMEENKDFSMCVHNTIKHDLSGKKKDKYFNDWNDFRILTEEDVFVGWKIHTTSYFARRKACELPEFSLKYWFGDFVRLTIAYSQGKIAYLPYVMSIYNYNNPNGIVNRIFTAKDIKKIELKKEYLYYYNEYTNRKFETSVEERIKEIDYEIIITKFNMTKNYNEFLKNRKLLFENEYYIENISKMNFFERLKNKLKFENYLSFLFIKLMNKLK